MAKTLYLHHGSNHPVPHPDPKLGRVDNDYGIGFYTTEDPKKADEWAAGYGREGAFRNKYSIDPNGLNILRLDEYGTLAWIAEIISHRGVRGEDAAVLAPALIDNYKIDTRDADIIIDVTRLMFRDIMVAGYDLYEGINAYLRTSSVRAEMDKGLPRALNKGDLQLMNSIDFTGCGPRRAGTQDDDMMRHWLADIYTYLQWMTGRASKEIGEKLPAAELAKRYYPLHEAALPVACDHLKRMYLSGEKKDG